MFDPPPTNGDLNGVTDRFIFVDGNAGDRQVFLEPFKFPWSSGEPNDGGGDSNCVR